MTPTIICRPSSNSHVCTSNSLKRPPVPTAGGSGGDGSGWGRTRTRNPTRNRAWNRTRTRLGRSSGQPGARFLVCYHAESKQTAPCEQWRATERRVVPIGPNPTARHPTPSLELYHARNVGSRQPRGRPPALSHHTISHNDQSPIPPPHGIQWSLSPPTRQYHVTSLW